MSRSITTWSLVLVAGLTLGCASVTDTARKATTGLSQATLPVRQSWRRATEYKQDAPIVNWQWTMGIPVDTPRAELLATKIPHEAIAQFLPQLPENDIRLVSTGPQLAGYSIANIDGKRIDNCADLHNAIEQVPESAINVQVDLSPTTGAVDAPQVAVRVDQPTLMALGHATATEHSAFRVSEAGNPTVVIRNGGIRSQLVMRIERDLGLVQLVLASANCWDEDVMLPKEVRVECDGQPLRCLTVSDTLEMLYGEPEDHQSEASASFAEVSEREDYLLPVNYNRLSEKFTAKNTGMNAQSPAFARLDGMKYPGPAVLADARALTGIMLQQHLLKKGERSQAGWLVFAGANACSAKHVDVSIDFGGGLSTYRFMIPEGR